MLRLIAFAFLFLTVLAAVVLARPVAFADPEDTLPVVIGPKASERIYTPLSTERDQRRTLKVALGGAKRDFKQHAEGWMYDSGRDKRIAFIVPKGAMVDTSKGLRWEGQRVKAEKFYIWWP